MTLRQRMWTQVIGVNMQICLVYYLYMGLQNAHLLSHSCFNTVDALRTLVLGYAGYMAYLSWGSPLSAPP